MKKLICSFALTVLFMFYSSHSFAETVLMDTATGNTSTLGITSWSSSGSYGYGSVIAPSNDMNVSSFSFYLKKNTSNDNIAQPFKAYIYESSATGVLSGSAIAQSSEQISTTSTTYTEVNAALTSAVTLSSGSYYTLIYSVGGVSGTDSNDRYRWNLTSVTDAQNIGAWYSNVSDGISQRNFNSSWKYALKIYGPEEEEEVVVATTCAGTGPNCKDLTYWESIEYFGLTPVFTLFPGPNSPVPEPTVFIGIDSFVSFDKG